MKIRELIYIMCLGVWSTIHPQNSIVSLTDFHQLSFPMKNPEYLGNTYLPAWSKEDRYIGTTFHDPNRDIRYIMIYDLNTGSILKYNTGMISGKDKKQRPFSKKMVPKDTHTIFWSPIKETTFYSISRDRKIDQLFKISFKQSGAKMEITSTQNISPLIPGLVDNHVLSYSLSNPLRERFYILFSLGKEGNLDIYSYIVSKSGKYQVRSVIRNPDIDEYDIQSFITKEMKHYVFQGKIGNQDDIFSLKQSRSKIDNKIINLTQTNDLGERNPRFNPSGTRIAFLRTDKLFISDISEEAKKTIVYTLVVYDFKTGIEQEVYPNAYVMPDVFHQNPFIWLTDDLILYVDNNVEKKFPLKLINVVTFDYETVSSPYINYKDLALSHSGKQLAFIAKGTFETDDLSFNKLFVCNIEIK